MITSRQVLEIINKQIANETPEAQRALSKVIEKIEVLEDINLATRVRGNYSTESKKAREEADKFFTNNS